MEAEFAIIFQVCIDICEWMHAVTLVATLTELHKMKTELMNSVKRAIKYGILCRFYFSFVNNYLFVAGNLIAYQKFYINI